MAARQRESGRDAGHIVCFVPLKDCVEIGVKDYEWMLGKPVVPNERIEIPGRLGLFDVTEKIPDTLKSQLDARRIKTVSVASKQPAAEKTYPLHEAAANGELRIVKSLLKDNPTLAFTKDGKGNTPLHYATANAKKEVAEFLLRHYVKENSKKLGSRRKRLS